MKEKRNSSEKILFKIEGVAYSQFFGLIICIIVIIIFRNTILFFPCIGFAFLLLGSLISTCQVHTALASKLHEYDQLASKYYSRFPEDKNLLKSSRNTTNKSFSVKSCPVCFSTLENGCCKKCGYKEK